jgi:hypothetical protein
MLGVKYVFPLKTAWYWYTPVTLKSVNMKYPFLSVDGAGVMSGNGIVGGPIPV